MVREEQLLKRIQELETENEKLRTQLNRRTSGAVDGAARTNPGQIRGSDIGYLARYDDGVDQFGGYYGSDFVRRDQSCGRSVRTVHRDEYPGAVAGGGLSKRAGQSGSRARNEKRFYRAARPDRGRRTPALRKPDRPLDLDKVLCMCRVSPRRCVPKRR